MFGWSQQSSRCCVWLSREPWLIDSDYGDVKNDCRCFKKMRKVKMNGRKVKELGQKEEVVLDGVWNPRGLVGDPRLVSARLQTKYLQVKNKN